MNNSCLKLIFICSAMIGCASPSLSPNTSRHPADSSEDDYVKSGDTFIVDQDIVFENQTGEEISKSISLGSDPECVMQVSVPPVTKKILSKSKQYVLEWFAPEAEENTIFFYRIEDWEKRTNSMEAGKALSLKPSGSIRCSSTETTYAIEKKTYYRIYSASSLRVGMLEKAGIRIVGKMPPPKLKEEPVRYQSPTKKKLRLIEI